MEFIIFFSLFCLHLHGTNGAVLKFVPQTPGESNNETCGLISCQHELGDADLYVQEVRLYNVIETASSRLVVVDAETCDHAGNDDVIVVTRSFSRSGAHLELGLRNPHDCRTGEFMCEVIYLSGQLKKRSAVTVIRPNQILVPVNSLFEKFDEMRSAQDALQKQLGSLEQQMTSPCLQYPEGTLAFRGTAYSQTSVYNAYKLGSDLPKTVQPGCKKVGVSEPCTSHFRNDAILDDWRNITEVTFAVYKDNVKVKEVVFNAVGSNYTSWFDKVRVKRTSWPDVVRKASNVFSIDGHHYAWTTRTFFMSSSYNGCDNDMGWFVAVDEFRGACDWEISPGYPAFKYAFGNGSANWNSTEISFADYFAIFVK